MNAFTHPAYLGSLCAICVSIFWTIVEFIINNDMFSNNVEHDTLQDIAYILALLLSMCLVVRCYIAVSMNAYTDGRNFLSISLPPTLRIMLFHILIIIFLLANLVSVVASGFNVWVLIGVCTAMNFISIFVLCILWIAHQFRRTKIPAPLPGFTISDVIYCIFCLMTCYVLYICDSTQDINAITETSALAGVMIGVIILLSVHDLRSRYLSSLRKNLADLASRMRKE